MKRRTRKQSSQSLSQKLVNLVTEPEFIRFENILREPNFFKIVGRTHYERWHACFLGWLLDPLGSHLLGNFPLTRFLLLLLDDKCLKASNHTKQELFNFLPMLDFREVSVAPNEYLSTETSIEGLGRFDIFVNATFADGSANTRILNLIVELKIDSKPDAKQSKKYADWLHGNHPQNVNL